LHRFTHALSLSLSLSLLLLPPVSLYLSLRACLSRARCNNGNYTRLSQEFTFSQAHRASQALGRLAFFLNLSRDAESRNARSNFITITILFLRASAPASTKSTTRAIPMTTRTTRTARMMVQSFKERTQEVTMGKAILFQWPFLY
jgi:hypothetical protein